MLELVVSGGQTGADQAGWRAAQRAGFRTGGYMPRGFKTEDGPRPEFAETYGAKEHGSADYRDRTRDNAAHSSGTIIFNSGKKLSAGTLLAQRACLKNDRPCLVVTLQEDKLKYVSFSHSQPEVGRWIERYGIKILNIAGNRESGSPGIGDLVEDFLVVVFRVEKQTAVR